LLSVNLYYLKSKLSREGATFSQRECICVYVRSFKQAEQLILERPKVIFNAATRKYVMWFHLDATHSAPPAPASPAAAARSVASDLRRDENSSSALGSNNTTDDDDDDEDEGEETRRIESQGASTGAGQGFKPSKVKRRKYWIRRAGVAVADYPQGPFVFVHAIKPDGEASLDLQVTYSGCIFLV